MATIPAYSNDASVVQQLQSSTESLRLDDSSEYIVREMMSELVDERHYTTHVGASVIVSRTLDDTYVVRVLTEDGLSVVGTWVTTSSEVVRRVTSDLDVEYALDLTTGPYQ